MDRFIRTATTLSYTITSFKYHEQFNTEDMRNDIALMFLNGQVPPNFPTVQPISPATYAVQPGSICQINGWGTDAFVSFRKFAILFKSEILAQGGYRQLQPMHNAFLNGRLRFAGFYLWPIILVEFPPQSTNILWHRNLIPKFNSFLTGIFFPARSSIKYSPNCKRDPLQSERLPKKVRGHVTQWNDVCRWLEWISRCMPRGFRWAASLSANFDWHRVLGQ